MGILGRLPRGAGALEIDRGAKFSHPNNEEKNLKKKLFKKVDT